MILKRHGNKEKLSKKLTDQFPNHKIYVEPFFGAGGLFFNKQKARFNILNDLDSDVFNLFQVVSDNKNDLEEAFYKMPIHQDLLNFWKTHKEEDPIKKAIRFLFLSNFTLYGSGSTLVFGASRAIAPSIKASFPEALNKTFDLIQDVQFSNTDFRVFLNSISLDDRATKGESSQCFIYCDPPYLDTSNNYSHSFTKKDSLDLFDCLIQKGCKFAVSEFDNPFILDIAKKKGLNLVPIVERRNVCTRGTEILITNYSLENKLF